MKLDFNYSPLVLVSKTPEKFQTGWFFTPRGHILTAGHMFNKSDLEVEVFVPALNLKTSARILEIKHDERFGYDWAILAADVNQVFQTYDLTVEQKDFVGREIAGRGCAATLDDRWISFEGKIVGNTLIGSKNPRHSLFQIGVAGADLQGLSGAPILMETLDNSNRFTAIGIQTEQGCDQNSSVCFATKLQTIAKLSSIFRHIIGLHTYKPPEKTWKLTELDKWIKHGSAKRPTAITRQVFFIRPMDNVKFGAKLLDDFQSKWHGYEERIQRVIRQVVGDKCPKIYIKTEIANSYSQSPQHKHLATYFAKDFPQTPPQNENVRVVCDLTGDIDVSNGPTLANFPDRTHLVAISIGDNPEIKGSTIDRVDCSFTFKRDGVAQLSTQISNVIEDCLLDAAIFNALPILSHLFPDVASRQLFSKIKLEYARKRKLSPYGLSITDPSLSYVTFAGCMRRDFEATCDYNNVESVWGDFLDSYLIRSLPPGRHQGQLQRTKTSIIENFLREFKKHAGSISLNKLSKKMQKFQASDELCAIAILVRMPRTGAEAQQLRKLFLCKKLAVNRICVLRQFKLAEALKHPRRVQLYFFRGPA